MVDVITISNFLIMLITGIILSLLTRKIYARKNKLLLEKAFGLGMLNACIASFIGALFQIPYILSVTELQSWFIGSYIYYVFVILSLGFVLSCGIGILAGNERVKLGFVSFIAVIPLTLAYLLGYVEQKPGTADMSSTIEGIILLYGVVGLLLAIIAVIYLKIYLYTRVRSSGLMFTGITIIIIGAALGGVADILSGELGRMFDPVGFLTTLAGIYIIYSGFNRRPSSKSI
ncbi:MAG: hypothetical protein ACFFD4_29100 [Candidatus Odinarchaeota archaeon]